MRGLPFTPALITGATADRLKFGAYAVFIGVWLTLVYSPIAHMVFAGGWLADMGAHHFDIAQWAQWIAGTWYVTLSLTTLLSLG